MQMKCVLFRHTMCRHAVGPHCAGFSVQLGQGEGQAATSLSRGPCATDKSIIHLIKVTVRVEANNPPCRCHRCLLPPLPPPPGAKVFQTCTLRNPHDPCQLVGGETCAILASFRLRLKHPLMRGRSDSAPCDRGWPTSSSACLLSYRGARGPSIKLSMYSS